LLERGHCLQQHALVQHAGGGADRKRQSFSATSLPTLVAMVEEGLGITLLPDLARDGGVARGHDLQLTALAGATPRKIALAWRTSTSHAGLFAEIGDMLIEARNDLHSREH
jgi:LysR family hydrogen peroxide-inducible transcriptional activator